MAAPGVVNVMNREAISRLADAWGIERDFLDYKKDLVEIPFAARSRILSLMRHFPQDESALARELDPGDAEALAPCLVFREGEELRVPLRSSARLAREVGLCARVHLEAGSPRDVEVESICASPRNTAGGKRLGEARELRLKTELPPGYHRLELHNGRECLTEAFLFVMPAQAYEPGELLRGERLFGLSVQLYTVRSERNWGMGDFTDLANLVRGAAKEGVQVVGVNPLHALFPANPLHFSPYSPSNRAFLNAMYIDPLETREYVTCEAARALVESADFQERLARLREVHYVDYDGVAAARWEVLKLLFQHFCERELAADTSRARAFLEFCDREGDALRLHATYDCLHEHFLRKDLACWGWPVWPEEYRSPTSAAVAYFADEHADRILYFSYLQWLAREQLLAVQELAGSLGMSVGIYLDLAVGVDLNGSEVWSNQESFALEASAGAPPDELARSGQNWGFPPLCPRMLERTGYELFARNLRANMSLCGAVRYDHAVSLLRLWWIPKEHSAAEGAYVRYDLDALLGIIALESQRQHCLVIGEDLGTVPDQLTERMEARRIFSYRVLYFEKTAKALSAPGAYPAKAIATITTHDLPTLASWWDGSDIDLRADLGQLGTDAIAEQMRELRTVDREHLLRALADAGCWEGSLQPADYPALTAELSVAVHRFLGRSNAGVLVSQLEDLMEMLTPVNVPGTFKEHRNWQRKLRYPLEGLFKRPVARAICAAMREERKA
ncbi:MAG: 4-alpha-glucanotransferase [Pseudomonadota bacterium]